MFICLAGWLSCVAKTYTGHYTQTFQLHIFIPAMLIGTIDFYHFILLSLTEILEGEVGGGGGGEWSQGQHKAKLLDLIFSHTFQLISCMRNQKLWCPFSQKF